MGMKPQFFFFLLLLPLVHSCRDSTPPGILDKEKFAAVYLALAEDAAAARRKQVETGRPSNADSTLSRFGVTKGEYEFTIRTYRKDMEWWKNFYAEVISIYDKKNKKATGSNRSVSPATEGTSQVKIE